MSDSSKKPSEQSLASRLLARLDPDQSVSPMGARDLVSLGGSESIFGLLEGELDVFLVEERGEGRRRFVLSVGEGELVPSLEAAGPGQELPPGLNPIGVPSNGARLARFSIHQVRELAQGSSADRALLIELIESSLAMFAHSFEKGRALPRAARSCSPGESLSASPGDPLQGSASFAWLRLPPRSLLPVGLPRTSGEADGFPRSTEGWVPLVPGQDWKVTRAWETRGESTGTLLDGGEWAAAYGEFLAYTLHLHVGRLAREDLQENSLTSERTTKFEGIFLQAKETLGSVLVPKSRVSASPGEEPLVGALRLVAISEGCPLGANRDEMEARLSAADPVAAILQLSGIVPRPVALEGPWWRQDHGALLGFRGPEREPHALLPRFGRRGYWSIDPQGGKRKKVDIACAGEFASDGVALLRPFEREIKSPFALLRFGARGATGDFVMIFLMMLLVALGNMVTPIVTGEVMGPITADARTNDLVALLGLMFVVGGAGVAFGFVEAIAGLRVEGRMGNSIQTAVWLKLLDLPMNFFERYVIGDLVNRADGVDSLRSLLSSSLTRTVLHAISGLTSVALLIYYNWKITVAVAGLATIYLAATIPAGFIFLSLKRKIQGLSGQTEGLIFQLLTNQTKIRMAGAEKIAFSRWSELYEEMQHCTYRDRLVNLCLNLIKGVLQTLALAMILLIVGIESGAFQSFFSVPSSLTEINRNPLIRIMPTASFVAFNVAMGQFMGSIFALGETVMTLLTAVPLYQRVKPILEAMPEASDAQRIQLPAIRGRIAFKGVTYRYRESEPNILENFSFHVEPGEMVALVGESGAGKSTVIRLLLAFDSPQKGSILLDDTPLAQLDPKSLRAQFGVVMQDAQLIAGSILENIAGGTNLTEEDAMDAAGLAGLDKDLAGMPMGLQTVVMEGAGTISGGQRQRILIARALARRPSLILFDEATSALDNESQAQVTESIAELAVSRVVIAHRLSTIVASDRICYVGEGRVLEQGTYSELMAINGRFAELARRQLT